MIQNRTHPLIFVLAVAVLALAALPAAVEAQTGIVFVKNNKVGILKSNPVHALDVVGTLQIANAGTANIRFNNGGGSVWNFQNNGTTGHFEIRNVSGTKTPVVIETSAVGNLFRLKGGTVEVLGSQVHPDYVFEPDFELESIEDHAAYMWENKHLPAVGAGKYDEDGNPVIQLGAAYAGLLEELEKAHIYIDQLNQALTEERKSGDELAARLARLEALVEAGDRVE